MMNMFKKTLKILSIFTLGVFFLSGCMFNKSKDEDGNDKVVEKKKRFEPDVRKRIRQSVESEGSVLFGKKSEKSFANVNVMWRATIETLDDFPLTTVDYGAGLIVSDWYSEKNDSVKIQVNFLSDEVRASSISVKTFKKTCDKNNNCSINSKNQNLNTQIKSAILNKIREISLKESTKK